MRDVHIPNDPSGSPPRSAGSTLPGCVDAVVPLEPRRATEDELALVHPRPYLEALRAFCAAGWGHLDPDTGAGPGSWDTALLAAGAALAAVDGLAEGHADAAFVAARPPGHHADRRMCPWGSAC